MVVHKYICPFTSDTWKERVNFFGVMSELLPAFIPIAVLCQPFPFYPVC